ncbi:MAG: cytochrome c-type biogenesis protein [Boseongicola sp.]
MIRAILLWLLMATAGFAVQPDEILGDSILEARARELSKGLRCLVCRNESIDESNAELARDLRLLVRERLVAGDTDREALNFIVARYGEYVLLKPLPTGGNLVLYLVGPVLFVMGGVAAAIYIRRRRVGGPEALNESEKVRLSELLDE